MTAPATAPTADVDPIDSLNFDEIGDAITPVETAIPEHMVLGGKPKDEVPEPTVEAKPEAQAEPKADALPEGYKRDTLGRVHGPDGKIVSADALAKLATPPQQPADTEKPSPFQYRANKETKSVEGWEQHADGSVRVPPEKAGELRQLLNARDMLEQYPQHFDRMRGEIERLTVENEQFKTGKSAKDAQADALVSAYTKVLQEPDERRALEGFFQLREQLPTLLAQAEARHWQSVAKAGRPAPSPKAGPTTERASEPSSTLPPVADAIEATTDAVEHLKLDHQFRDMTAEDWRQFDATVTRTPYAFLRPATAEDAQKYGVTAGQIVRDDAAIKAAVTAHATQVRAQRETAKQQTALAAETARKTQTSITAPPTPGGGGTPPKAGAKPINSKQDLEDWWNSSEL